jgi:hypothetical protein
MNAEISLACWILGLDDADAFLVDIPPSKTVSHLKDAIKTKIEPILNHIAAHQLAIWKVSDRYLEGELRRAIVTRHN